MIAITLFFAAVSFVLLRSDPNKLAAEDVQRFVKGLNEAAAIGVPHDFLMSAQMKEAQAGLLAKVERGEELTESESRDYRMVYQTVLQDSQNFLGRFDAELTVLSNYAMTLPNNVSGFGVSGPHDHHDLSARKNFEDLLNALKVLDQPSSSWSRIVAANRAQKQLVDLISHVGVMPHTVSIKLEAVIVSSEDQVLAAKFEEILHSFKVAQFNNVNSPAYWSAVDNGLEQYVRLILAVQDKIWERTTVPERRIAGRFLAIQTFAPPVDINRPLRPRRTKAP